MKRVAPLQIVHAVSSLEVGGMEQLVIQMAAAQQGRGRRVGIMALRGGGLLTEADRLGVNAVVIGAETRVQRGWRGISYMRKWRPQIIHAHNSTSLHYAMLGRFAARSRVLMTFHGEGKGPGRMPRRLEWRNTDVVVAVSEQASQRMYWPKQVRSVVIRNGVAPLNQPLRNRDQVRRSLELGDEAVGIIVARLDHLKGHRTLLEAIALLKAQGVKSTILMAGDGNERGALEAQARHLGLGSEQVRFLGLRLDVPDLLGAADFFVLPSLTEGLPLSVLEAMRHGLATIATPVGGIPDLITDGVEGLLVPTEAPAALADAIRRFIDDPALRAHLGASARRRVLTEFSFDKMLDSYDELYETLGLKR